MILVPEYSGVCSCRIVSPPPPTLTINSSAVTHVAPETGPSNLATVVSRPSASERTWISDGEGRAGAGSAAAGGGPLRAPRPPRLPRPGPPGPPVTYATRVPSRDTERPRPGICAHTGVAGCPPSAETCISVPLRRKYSVRLSALQNTPVAPRPSVVTATGFDAPSAGTTYRSCAPARSQMNATRRLSRDQTGDDGCLNSMSFSIDRRPGGATA